jgi:2-oxoglutarate ferredoxin oxidoreductase subunit alpha
VLLVGWGSTFGPIRESVDRLRSEGHKAGCLHMRHLHPLPQHIGTLFKNYDKVVVVEMNDAGAYGCGQLAMLLRAKLADPRITSLTKTDGLAFRIREVVTGVEKLLAEG